MNTWITTDTHFFHAKMHEFCGRPEDYEIQIHKGFKNIPEGDTLIHLGDICMGEDVRVHEMHIRPLKCKKILVRGNHDSKSNSWYLDHGWDFVCDSFMNKYYGVKILFSHKPQWWDGTFDINFHGHLHNLGHREEEKGKVNKLNYLISLEFMGYKPLSLKSLVEPIKASMNENGKGDCESALSAERRKFVGLRPNKGEKQ